MRTANFYFLEMNTRLQVEHPVTELVSGLDLVQWQIRIAAGERLPVAPLMTEPRGWAIECRITSEDAGNDFLPSTGVISFLRVPGGPGVRWDGGVGAGSEIGLHYDPLLGKLIAWADTRDAAIARMRRALLELTIVGVETSRDFHLRVMDDAEFQTRRDRHPVARAPAAVAHRRRRRRRRERSRSRSRRRCSPRASARGGSRSRHAASGAPPAPMARGRVAHRGACATGCDSR